MKQKYPTTTLAALTIIVLFSDMLEFSTHKKKILNKRVCEENYWLFKNILYVELKISKSFNYSTNMCWS